MITFMDKCYCASDVKVHTCGREMIEKERREAIRLNALVSCAYFCSEPTEEGIITFNSK
jgi:hypothetical protein